MAVPVDTEPSFTYDTPEHVFGFGGYYFASQGRDYDISPDGQRFVFLTAPGAQRGQDAAPQIIPRTELVRGTQTPRAGRLTMSLQTRHHPRPVFRHRLGAAVAALWLRQQDRRNGGGLINHAHRAWV